MKNNTVISAIKFFAFFITFMVSAAQSHAAMIETIKYDEIRTVGEGITDGLGYTWRFKWDGKGGEQTFTPTGPLPDSETFWKSEVIFSVHDRGYVKAVTFASTLHKAPFEPEHQGDFDRNQTLKTSLTDIAFFTETLGVGTHRVANEMILHPSTSPLQHKDFIYVDFIKEANGDLFFEMRGEHTRVNEPASAFLLCIALLGLMGRYGVRKI
jgi:hypothetical protein